MKKILPITILVILIDRITKIMMLNLLTKKENITIIKNFFSLTLAKNTGVAFSLLEGQLTFIILSTIIITLFLLEYLKNSKQNYIETIGYSLVIGGAIGNLIDRIKYKYVIDFIDFKIINYNFPIFNIADACIVIGILILIYQSLQTERSKQNATNSRKKTKNRQISNRKTRRKESKSNSKDD